MEYISKPVRCHRPGLTQEEALDSLYERYGNVRVASIRQRAGIWVADILIPKTAGDFPPKDDGGGESDSPEPAPDTPEDDEGPESDDSGRDSDGDFDGDEGGPPKEKGEHGKGGTEHQILSLLHEIAQALGVGGGMPHDGMPPGGPDAGPPGPPGPGAGGPPGGGMGGGGSLPPVRKPTKLRPGEVLPTQTPIGTPAFSSAHLAMGANCPTCGGPLGPDGSCPTCGPTTGPQQQPMGPGGGVSSPMAPGGAYSRKVATFTATQTTNLPVKQAKAELEGMYSGSGYRVKQIVAGTDAAGNRELRALLSIR